MKVALSVIASGLSGSAGDVTAFKWKGIQSLRTRVTPANPNSAGQQLVRAAMARVVALAQSLPALLKTFLDVLGNEQKMSGFNVAVGPNLKLERDDHYNPIVPANRHCPSVAGMAVATGVGAGGITLTWTTTDWLATDIPQIFLRKKDTVGDEYATPWTVFDPGATTMQAGTKEITGLTAGTDYAVALVPKRVTEWVGHDDIISFGGGMVDNATSHA
jgi:hypothetical protein